MSNSEASQPDSVSRQLMSMEQLQIWTIKDLKAWCSSQNLKISGRKEVLAKSA